MFLKPDFRATRSYLLLSRFKVRINWHRDQAAKFPFRPTRSSCFAGDIRLAGKLGPLNNEPTKPLLEWYPQSSSPLDDIIKLGTHQGTFSPTNHNLEGDFFKKGSRVPLSSFCPSISQRSPSPGLLTKQPIMVRKASHLPQKFDRNLESLTVAPRARMVINSY